MIAIVLLAGGILQSAQGLRLHDKKAALQDLSTCPGDHDENRVNKKCNNDVDHRICVKLMETNINASSPDHGKPLSKKVWSGKTFWDITSQTDAWASNITTGGHWCISMWSADDLINNIGCGSALDVNCAATDVESFLAATSSFRSLTKAKNCFKCRCKGLTQFCLPGDESR